MTLIDSEVQRTHWLARAEYVRGAIADLRQDITVALQDHPNISPNVVIPLAEADVHLDVAMHKIDEAIARITALRLGRTHEGKAADLI